ncbi:MAG: hypothetical protein HYV08_16010 [Deltaproteobacteria bacterium]|nr:hypothetical protein [Deltaproteobacteria bacterium]
MTARPGRIKEVVPVGIGRPRRTTGAEEVQVLDYLAAHIKEEVEKAMQGGLAGEGEG